jgi:hypothetical protein
VYGPVTCVGELRSAFKILVINLNVRDDLEHLGVGRKIFLKWILKEKDETILTGFIWSCIWTIGWLL